MTDTAANDREKVSTTDSGKDNTRHCTSLPLFYNDSELCALGERPGMECMPLRTPPGPYHYHVADQTKSLQELQNEVGALLEFRDLVIETFPDLKHKMASISTTNTLTGMASSSSLVSRREWEPGIRVKRKLAQKDNTEMSSSSLIRSRSNSHSGKKEPKSSEGNGSVVQDSGFSTETSSSKEAHSASSTTGAIQGNVASNRLPIDADDELLNLLDVIHRKSNRLRDEVEHLQNIERNKLRKNVNDSNSSNSFLQKTFQDHVDRLSKEDIQVLRKERDRLLDKLAEMEAETLAGRIKATKMNDQLEELNSYKKELEEQLKIALSQKIELNSRLQDISKLHASKNSSSSSDLTSSRLSVATTIPILSSNATTLTQQTPQQLQGASKTQLIGSRFSALSTLASSSPINTFSPVIVQKQESSSAHDSKNDILYPFHGDSKQVKNDLNNLGRLDGLVSSPHRASKVRVTDSKKIAAILLETNVLELQRHLLTLTVQNQVLMQRLEQATKSKIFLMKKLDKSKEDIEDMRFQLEEKDIELEGTKAQLRVLESKTPSKLDSSTDTIRSSSTIMLSSRDSPVTPTQISTPSMKAMVPYGMDEVQPHSSSTESAQDQTERDARTCLDTPKRRPSKIPLPGSKGYLAPKPPTGRNSISQRSPSGPVSNRSLSKSTSSLYGKSGPPSVNKRDTMTTSSSLNRPESAQSLRKDSSLGTNSRSSSSSIPISSKSTPSPNHKISNSPLPKPKRDSLTSRVRHLDSLSRVQQHSSSSSPAATTSSTSNLHKLNSNSKKDLSSSISQGQLRNNNSKQGTLSVRRVSSASIGRGTAADLQQNESDSGKINDIRNAKSVDISEQQLKSSSVPSRDLIRNYLAKTCVPPAILKPSYTAYDLSPDGQYEFAYKHPQLLFEMDMDDTDEEDNIIISSNNTADRNFETNKETEIKYVTNSTERIDLSAKAIKRNNNNCNNYTETSSTIPVACKNESKICRLVGKVNPIIAKTWEQLNSNRNCNIQSNNINSNRNQILSRSASNISDDSEKLLFYQPIQESKSSFHVNKVVYSGESSETFFDSIDNAYDSGNDNYDDNIVSISQQDAGEDMAEIDSYDRARCQWSIESDFK